MGSKFFNGNHDRERILLRSQMEWMVPRVYASLACALWNRGWTAEQIQDVFADSQLYWEDSRQNGWDMLKNVEEVTGIGVTYFKERGNIV